MSTDTIDRGRAAVYAAELAAFDGTDLEAVRPPVEVLALIARLTGSVWWVGPRVVTRSARSDSGSSSTRGDRAFPRSSAVVTIRLSGAQSTVATAAHELAHALAGVAHGHDAVFRRAYLDVVTVITNLDPADRRGHCHRQQLQDAFDALGLMIGERTWPPPDPAVSSPIAL